MESKKLSFNVKYIGRELLRHWPIWAVPCVIYLLLITCTAGMYNSYDSFNSFYSTVKEVIRSLLDVSGAVSFIMGLVASYAAFGFLGNKKKHYFFEFLPMNRLSHFANRFVFGYFLMFIPGLFIFVVEVIQVSVVSGEFIIAPLASWLLINAAQNVFWLSFGILFMVVCGKVSMAGFCYFAFSVFGFIIEYTLAFLNSFMFIGIEASSTEFTANIGILSPLEYIISYGNYSYVEFNGLEQYFGVSRLLTVFFAAIVLIVCEYLLYKRRKAERTGDNIVFDFMKTVFSWCFTIVFDLELTFIIMSLFIIQNEGIAHYPGYRVSIVLMILIFGIMGYMVSRMIIEKRFNVFKKSLKGALVCSGVFALLMIAYMHDIFNIEKYVPEPDDIGSYRIYSDQYLTGHSYTLQKDTSYDDKKIVCEFMKIIVSHMDELVENHKEANDIYYNYDNSFYSGSLMYYSVGENYIEIDIGLKNGKNIYRTYYIRPEGKLYEEIKAFVLKHPNFFAKGNAEVNFYYD